MTMPFKSQLNQVLCLWLCMTMLACGSAEDKAPADLLTPTQMVPLLIDIHLAESKTNMLRLSSSDSSLAAYRFLERGIFKKYKIDTARYRRSFQYYAAHPKDFQKIYEEVETQLKAREKSGKID
jgi:Domain of unknown function (DUF4296)